MKGLKKMEVKDTPVKRLKLNVVKTGIRAGVEKRIIMPRATKG